MKILLSPAKSLNENVSISNCSFSQPTLLNQSEKLIGSLKKMKPSQIKELMGVSNQIAELNFNRFQSWSVPFNEKNASPCGWMFSGAAYKGLDFANLTNSVQEYSQDVLRILSGLYGVLRPFDFIHPYRLEMGTKLEIDRSSNLYKFWGDQITNTLNAEIEAEEWVVNLASNEYFKAINTKILKGKLVSCSFKENKSGQYKIVMAHAKKARGLMTRFILEHKISKKNDLLAFDYEGYKYIPSISSESELVFVR